MLNRKVLPLVLVMIFAGVFWAFQSQGENGKSLTTQQKILTTLGSIIEQNHYSPKPINDAFSKEVFKRFLQSLDPDKNILLQSDIQALRKYETTIDDEIHGATLQFVPAVNDVYNKRLLEVSTLYKDILKQPFDYSKDEEIVLDNEKTVYGKNEAERREKWRKKLKFMALERYTDLLDQREKNKSTKDYVAKSDADLEKEARDKVSKIMDKTFDRLKAKFTDEERFNVYINAITSFQDPHSDYFPPVEKRSFDEQMSGRFFGIGASLREEDGNIKIATLLTGSPAWKSGELTVGDVVLKVGQGSEEAVDLTGFAVEDAVKIIRGTKGTEVRLTLRKQDGSIKVVSLIRDEIVQDEVYVRSAILNGKQKIGYIYLPDFYADYEKPNGARSASDVAREIIKLKSENVEGIIIDLRFNGGGYLNEVIQMVGLFIPEGPVVQVKDREGKPTIYTVNEKNVLYTGPLTVLVNEQSASASEIFAAAIQDYGRGIVLGSSSTYGKGTVQRAIPFGKPLDFFSGRTEFGAVKLTLQKYYRIDGGSTQLKGVIPDVVLPDEYEYLKIREKDNKNAMPWDQISKASFRKWNGTVNLSEVAQASQQRVKSNTNFQLLDKNAKWLAEQNNKIYSLNLEKYRAEQQAIRSTVKQNEKLTKLENELPFEGLKADNSKYNNVDKEKGERYKTWLKNLRTDIYINEATAVVSDMINAKKSVAKN
ncbi:carboxy terminal-processing peptidase [Aridibaculum aurantiacum]|uniref:carboxy terminal-processing peptidase n=1 Tax=Aridibaculum aurantiacum TaxID=2810307 RepID=UPI001A96C552|nr:carboxy terminal-processing peptidase [Aridibaculum aurantiacum]